ncbi:MAG TPA: DMT family transporter [Pseudonocardiaceae bacterium]|jgi:transporter family-2 protein
MIDAKTDSRRVTGVALALVVGALLAVQTRINGELGHQLHDGVLAALISFGTGLLALLACIAVSTRIRAGLRRVTVAVKRTELRWWHLCGGASGAYLVTCQGLTISSIGVAVFTVATVAGQAASGLVVDRLGVGPAGGEPVTVTRMLGAVGAVIAVLVAVSDRLAAPAALGLAALPLLAGFALSWQQAVNGRVAVASAPLPAAVVNFTAGTVVLVAVAAVRAAINGLPRAFPTDAWLYVGGLLGIPVIGLAALVVRWIGVLLLGLATVAGQILAALALDIASPATGWTPSAATVVGCLLALASVATVGSVGLHRGSRPKSRRRGARMAG